MSASYNGGEVFNKSTGLLNISGQNSTLNAYTLTLNPSYNPSKNRVSAQNGAIVNTKYISIGENPTPSLYNTTMTITGQNTVWTNEFQIDVSFYNANVNSSYNSDLNQLNILDGATLSTKFINSKAAINISGHNSTLNANDIYIYQHHNKISILNSSNNATVNAGGIFLYGNSILRITDNAKINIDYILQLNTNATLEVELTTINYTPITIQHDDPAETTYLRLHDSTLNIITDNMQDLTYGDIFTIIKTSATTRDTFKDLQEGQTAASHQGYDLIISYQGGDGNDITLTAIPEPTTIFTILTLAPVLLTRRKKIIKKLKTKLNKN